jgi:multidrug resistance efflux pump
MANPLLRKTYREEIYNYRPSWILRWGITASFIFLAGIIAVSGFIKYPDVIMANAEITTINPPVHLLARMDGKLEKVLVGEGDPVTAGDILAMLESPVDLEHLLVLDKLLNLLDSLVSNDVPDLIDPSNFSNKLLLGELQHSYSEVLMNYSKLYNYFFLNFNELELRSKEEEYTHELKYQELLMEKGKVLKQQFELAYLDFKRDSSLYTDGVIPEREFAKSRQQNDLQYRSLLTDLSMGMANSQTASARLRREIEHIAARDKETQLQLKLQLQQNIRLLRAAMNTWEKNYLLVSPIDGRASFTEYWNENQNVMAGNIVISVLPKEDIQVKTRIQFPILNSGKVKPGQRVNIKLENYPYQEFGMVVGEMGAISKIPNGSFYRADVRLVDGLVTSYGESLPLTQQATGQAEILTDEASLLIRFFNPIKAVFDERLQ